MSTSTTLLEMAAAVAVAVTAAFVVFVGFADHDAPLRATASAYVAAIDRDLRFVRSELAARRLVALQVLGVLAGLVVAAFGEPTALVVVPAVALAPKLLLSSRADQHVARLEEQTEGWLNAIANSLKASPSLGDAIASTISLVPSPLREEIDVLVKECDLGTPLDQALERLAERGRGRTLAGAVLALKVARRSGGDLPEMLEASAAALRELARLEGVVRTKTAEGKAQAVVIAAMPIPLVLGVQLTDPKYFEPLEGSFIGHLVVAGAAILWAIAVLVARKILAVDV